MGKDACLHEQRVERAAVNSALLFLLGGLGAAVGGGELVEQDGHDDVDQDVPDEHLRERSLSKRRLTGKELVKQETH